MSRKILVIDDDAQIRDSLQKLLRSEGYQVAVAADGPAGMKRLQNGSFDLLLLDLNLPLKSGWDTFEQLTSANPLMPVIIITGRRDQSELAAAAGAGALFEKPLDLPLLLRTMKQLLAQPPETHLERLAGLRSGAARPGVASSRKARTR